ncbi:N-acetylmuramoyl-L-alanine amidase [Proteinivorax hydrogeniformans]|uniref:N-acetylmuramoyl-L-alanine amidase n=1 Tax=Proteinivorax hydrogeniformans TaxID=1826727 RepID=A0AAU8HRY5_9FIRM
MTLSNLKTKFMTRNDCYTAGRTITPKGIMVHSTATPGVMAGSWFSRWNKSYRAGEINRQVCVHAFLDDKEIWQYLPWNHRGWHAGGAANNTHIGFEICEPAGHSFRGATMVGYDVKKNEAYFRAAWKNAVDLCVFLCKKHGLTEKDIIGHAEGHRQGIASNHADPDHWFPKHGESMDSFRAAVKIGLKNPKNEDFYVGDIVKIKDAANRYYPNGPQIPSWVKSTNHKITQNRSNGKTVLRGGRKAVLLGKKIHKRTGDESPGIMTWVDKEILELVDVEKEEKGAAPEKLYRVQVGAFGKEENAKALMDRLQKAGFDAYMRYE